MRPDLMDGIRSHLKPIGSFRDARILEIEPGHAKVSMDITEETLNFYGNVHGGFLFSLCDAVSGMATYAYEVTNVTQCSSFHFFRGISSGTLFVEANVMHKGRKTAVHQLEVRNEDGALIAAGTFTMFLGDPI
ncbi:MAG: PaaI family thioesterase [Lachnospiraceae bacterium]|nr:PaaI family thioesterase [Lachnospiraceae bacterium]